MARLTLEELTAASDRKDWNLLWGAAIPIVKFAMKRITRARNVAGRHVTDDMLQEAMEAAGRAVRTWRPLEHNFSTHIVQAAKGAIRGHIRAQASGMVGGRDARAVFKNIDSMEISEGGPRDFRDPADHLDEGIARAAVLAIRHPDERGAVQAYYGIGRPQLSMSEYADKMGVHRDTTTLWLKLGMKNIRQKLVKSP
jgi:RNA polymerase sigma factor (sigma-70 family)